MIEIFKTNVAQEQHAIALTKLIAGIYPHHRISFDLDDCDRILRIDGADFTPDTIVSVLSDNGYECNILE